MPLNINDPAATQNAIDQLAKASQDKNIDEITKQQISQGLDQFYNGDFGLGPGKYDYNSWGQRGGIISNLYDVLQAADAGQGIYGVRKINENQRNAANAMPGRAALIASKYGQGSAGGLGNPSGTGGSGNTPNSPTLGASKPLGSFF